jgi:two-component system, OmpR family, copper resistance phosphate regulon response regulator CusR
MRILLIEDDKMIAETIRSGLIEQRYYVDVAHDGRQGEDLAWSNDYDLIILDIMLPKVDGKEVCRSLRREGVQTPILMLTALASESDIIAGLDLGADDYLTKPFSFAVLLARIRSLIRRRSEHKTSEIRVADLVIDTVHRTAERRGQALNLTAKEFALLEYFVLNKGRVLSRDVISEHVWDMHFDPRSNVIESLMKCLRQKVDKEYDVQLIHTVWGRGYRFGENE